MMGKGWIARIGAGCCAALGSAAALAGNYTAANPLPALDFSIDNQSPTVQNSPVIRAGDVLRHPGPVRIVPRANLRLNSPLDTLDGLSLPYPTFPLQRKFVLRFSVDRASSGAADPAPALIAAGFPFNVKQQAELNQAAGDEFISLDLYTRAGRFEVESGRGSAGNNTEVRGQGDAGGVDYSLVPDIEPDAPNPDPLDDIKSGTKDPGSAGLTVEAGKMLGLFYTVERDSPSLINLPGSTGSGADLFFDENPGAVGGENIYVNALQLGVTPLDDIDGLIILENGVPGFQRSADQILFSLSRDSFLVKNGQFSAADVITTTAGGFAVFASAADLGLGPNDNIDMLDFAFCDDLETCIRDWAIGNPPIAVPVGAPWGVILAGCGVAAIAAWGLRRATFL